MILAAISILSCILQPLLGLSFLCFFLMQLLSPPLLLLARHPAVVYGAELLQFCTYGFLYPVFYYYVKECVGSGNMTKGQAVALVINLFIGITGSGRRPQSGTDISR